MEINNELKIQILKETIEDKNREISFYKRLLVGIVVFAIIGYLLAATIAMYYHERFVSFLKDYDFAIESYITTNDTSVNSGSVSVERRGD